MAVDLRGDERRHEALRGVEKHDRQPVPAAIHAPDVRPADVAAAEGADVLVLERAHEPVAGGDAAGDVASRDQDRERHSTGEPLVLPWGPSSAERYPIRANPAVDDAPVEVVEERL